MVTVKRILCLANSKKLSGRCVAGREISAAGAGPWLRPVSARSSEEVSELERHYKNGADPKLLDVIDVPLLQPHPHSCQTENWLLDPSQHWQFVRRADWNELVTHVEAPPTLWINGHSTYNGAHDQIPQAEADALPRSLYLIRAERLDLRVFVPGQVFDNPKRRVQARFQYAGIPYAFWVTDPAIERDFLAHDDGTYALGECCLTISLGEPFETKGAFYRYKLVAAIMERNGGGARWANQSVLF
jgi:hypothetical protein